MHLLLETGLGLGISAIYWGFGGALGVLLWRIRQSAQRSLILLASLALVVFASGTILILGVEAWPAWTRLLSITLGVAMVALAATRPAWSRQWWRRPSALHYLAFAMGLAALAELGLAWASTSAGPAIVGLAAGFACLASLRSALSGRTAPRVEVQ